LGSAGARTRVADAAGLDLLDALGVQATFFMLGMSVAQHRELAREIVSRGHEPACHGSAHEHVHRQSRDDFRRDVERCAELMLRGLREVASESPAPVLYLHPYECDPRPLRIPVPSTAARAQRARATMRTAWRNAGRTRVVDHLRAVASEFRLLSYESVYDELEQRSASRPRSLSPEGVVV
jgi:peptidoglycan/xylan/chitin deacetylase (PgdA/CDA1 family)